MINHIVMWNFKPELSAEERKEAGLKIKESLEGICDKITGIVSVKLVINELSSSNKDLALISSFESSDALNAYQVHPEHVKAVAYIKSVTCDRACIDYK